MRRLIALLVLPASLAGCSFFHKTLGLKSEAPAHREPSTTSIYGDWMLATIDSTAFAGAKVVELSLQPTTFTIRATYPNREPVVVSGTASVTQDGLLTLTPQTGMDETSAHWRAVSLLPGQPITVMATASGGSLIFASPTASAPVPSSVWHKMTAAERAGLLPKTPPDSVRRK